MLEFVVCRTRIRRLLVYQTYQTSRGWTTICSHTYDLQQIHPTMASMNFSSSKQWVKPPQRGIFPLDHDRECKEYMETYLACLKREQQQHNKCRELSKDYLQCRMDRQLMAKEDLNNMGFSEDTVVKNALEYDKSKEKSGYIAGKHIDKPMKWWFQR